MGELHEGALGPTLPSLFNSELRESLLLKFPVNDAKILAGVKLTCLSMSYREIIHALREHFVFLLILIPVVLGKK